MHAAPTVAPGTVIGEFRVESPLSAGGMGSVYVAEQLSTGKRRALKLMHPSLVGDPKSRLRFVEEARVGARIESEHVIEVVAAGVDEATGVPYLAMELLDGEDLAKVVARTGPLPLAALRALVLQLGHALGAAHAKGIVHRDLKPENVFIARSRRSGEALMVKVLDFGIAKTLEASRTAATSTGALGSPLCMAPEQASPGAPIRAETDVWALGLVVFFAATGRDYWRSAAIEPLSLQALLAEVLVHPLPPASERARELFVSAPLPAGFDAWFARCVAREPAQRFANAGACAEAFDAMLRGSANAASFAATAPIHAPGGPRAHTGPSGTAVMMPSFAGAPAAPQTPIAPGGVSGGCLGGLVAVAGLALLGIVGLGAMFALHAPAEPRPVEAPPPDPIPAPRAPALAPIEPSDTGRLTLVTVPWTNASIGGRALGRTPLEAVTLPAGEHLVELVNPALGIETTERVTIRAGETTRLELRLEAAAGAAPTPTSGGQLDASVIQRTLRARNQAFRRCYEDELRRDPSLEGRVAVSFTIEEGTGRVSRATVVENTTGSDAVGECVRGRVAATQFDPAPVGGDVDVTFPIVLRADGARGGDGAPTPSGLPATPSRSDVVAAMGAVTPAVRACGGGGMASVRVTFAGATGRVTEAAVSGPHAGTPTGACIARAVRAARVPPFSSGSFSANYPFRLQ
ncbi:MAG: AgmX/PglI C-terminal domain-containing protein [Sandaracinaceae bacterium]|nr:AgmX/PglI C-terminal domain-containing protein [Sandaracinaceae bacterium]